MQNITPLVSAVEKVVEAHRAILAAAERKAVKARDALAADQANDQAALAPIAQAAADLTFRLGELTNQRDNLLEEIRIGTSQLAQQKSQADEFTFLVTGNFGHPHALGNPGIFRQLMENRLHCLLAVTISPMLQAWLVEKQEALEETENQLAALAASAKLPAK